MELTYPTDETVINEFLREIVTMEEFFARHGVTPVDLLEADVRDRFPEVETPLVHRFTPGLYIREIFMPKGSLVISRIHKTEHPYIISLGDVSVWTPEGVVRLIAPFTGITKPGTQRILFMHEDTIFTTFHPGDETDVDEIEKRILEPHENLLLNLASK